MLTLCFSFSVVILVPCFPMTNLALPWVVSILCILMSISGFGLGFHVMSDKFSLMACAMIYPP